MRSDSFANALFAVLTCLCACDSFATSCDIRDGTLYLGKPKGLAAIVTPIQIFYVRDIWDPPTDISGMPKRELLEKALLGFEDGKDLVLDIEHWPLTGPSE